MSVPYPPRRYAFLLAIRSFWTPKKGRYTPVRYEGLKAAINGVSQKEKEYKNTPVTQSDCERLLNGGFILILVYIMYIILSCPEL